jgi:twitching motility protein PilT
MRLASFLSAVLCQIPVSQANGSSRIAAVEIMLINSAIRNLIREGRPSLLSNALRAYGSAGSTTLDEALAQLYSDGIITMETVMKFCRDHEEIGRLIQGTLPHHQSKTFTK